ncbi:MAG: heme ABC transporter ATP-binding protein [Burkholderiaceae bacterium]
MSALWTQRSTAAAPSAPSAPQAARRAPPDARLAGGDCGWLVCEAAAIAPPGAAVLATVSAAWRAGRLTAVLGPNGAGKSTLLGVLTGQHAPRSGRVWMDGEAVPPTTPRAACALARRRAVMLQESPVAFDFTVQEVVELGRYPHRLHPSAHEAAIVQQAMAATGVQHLAQRGIQSLSGGEKARAHLARALAQVWEPAPCGRPRWLLLDEPTAALDLAHQHAVLALLRERAEQQGLGVVVVLHDLNLALRYAHDAALLAGGTCRSGPVGEVLTPEAIAQAWGVRARVVLGEGGVRQYLFAAGAGGHGDAAVALLGQAMDAGAMSCTPCR